MLGGEAVVQEVAYGLVDQQPTQIREGVLRGRVVDAMPDAGITSQVQASRIRRQGVARRGLRGRVHTWLYACCYMP